MTTFTDLPLFSSFPDHKFTANSLAIFNKRYYQGSETHPHEVFQRVAQALADVEKDYNASDAEVLETCDLFFTIMKKGLALPAGRTLKNAGSDSRLVSNCIVLHIEDSMESIFSTLMNAALLQKAGSGLGFPFHKLRPAGFDTRESQGIASGPVSFLRMYDHAFGIVKQQNRHGANMAVMRVDHPDILEFVDCKRKEGDIKNFNISVSLTNAFLMAVERKDTTSWKCTWNGKLYLPREVDRTSGIVTKPIIMTAEQLFHRIAFSAWRNGEPGFLFPDTINKSNPLPGLGPLEACNPCLTADSWVTTSDGPRQIKQLVGIAYTLPSMIAPTETAHALKGFFSKGIKPVYHLKTTEGLTATLTSNHRLLTSSGWKEADKLEVGEKLYIDLTHPNKWSGAGTEDEGYLVGLVVGDGYLKDRTALICLWDTEESVTTIKEKVSTILLEHMGHVPTWSRIEDRHEWRISSSWLHDLCASFGVVRGSKTPKELIEGTSSAFYCGFLRGFFDCDGSPQGSSGKNGFTVRLSQSDEETLQVVQRMLLRLGIRSSIYRRREAGQRPLPDGKGSKLYECKVCYEVVISGRSTQVYAERIGFVREHKAAKLLHSLEERKRTWYRESPFVMFASLEMAGEAEVFTTTVYTDEHAYGAQGFIHRNCGEQNLHDGDVCNLGSINLGPFVVKRRPPTSQDNWSSYVDWHALDKTTRTMVRMLDNVIDRTSHPVEHVNTTFRNNRRIGLGIMGFSGMLYRLRIGYNTKQGREVADSVMEFIQESAVAESKLLGEKKGSFSNIHLSIYAGSVRRNAALTNIAPTGTTSMALDVGSGLEPEYALAYYKKVMNGTQMRYVNEELLYNLKEVGKDSDEILDMIIRSGTVQKCPDVPEWIRQVFVTSMDILPLHHVAMQAVFQRYVCNSISKTCNAPNSATIQDVCDIILEAWRSGCKGCTVYRDGSRTEQVLNLNTSLPTIPTLEECPSCTTPTLIRREGCISCAQCDYAKCQA